MRERTVLLLGLLGVAVIGATASAVGQDGSMTVSAPGTVLNRYTALASDAAAGSSTLVVASAGGLALSPGDLVLVIQMQGAVIDSSDTASFGAIASYGGAGTYELAPVLSVAGNTITIAGACSGLKHSYSAAAHSQVVRVPQYHDLTVSAGGSVVAKPWDGTTGGVIALHVQSTVGVSGSIDASGAGFRGGAVDPNSQAATTDVTIFRSAVDADGAEKGESIAGDVARYDALGGRYGRGAPANGGGGGDSHNGGGGGGANGDDGQPWTGQGVMDPAAVGAAAWSLDPAYAANGNALTRSSGGGRGGYTYSGADGNALVDPPGAALWNGNRRRERGGWGGRPLAPDAASRIFAGGGGGAGDNNNGTGGKGGSGGGIVIVVADTVTGSGSILANGANGADTVPTYNDGPGGGGGGGSIVVEANSLSGVALSADGGKGGNQPITNSEAEGPGGGGGGGFIAIKGGIPTRSAAGAAGGLSTSASATEFPANGATMGADGAANALVSAGALPFCRSDDLQITKDDGVTAVRLGQVATWTLTVTNDGDPGGVSGAHVTDPLPAGVGNASWTCSATPGSTCAAPSGNGPVDTTVDLAFGGTATFTVHARVISIGTGALVNTASVEAPAGVVDFDPANDSATDTDTVTGELGVAGSGCSCEIGDPGLAPLAGAALAGLALFFVRRRRR